MKKMKLRLFVEYKFVRQDMFSLAFNPRNVLGVKKTG